MGLKNTEATGIAEGVSFPGVLVLDSQGKLKEKFFEDSYRDRLTANTLLGRLFPALVMTSEPIKTEDFSYSLSSTDNEVIIGNQVDLLVDIDLPEGSHLYAPGSPSYVPLSLKIEESDYFQATDTELPLATFKHLEAINESVGVYSGKVRIRQGLKMKSSKEIASLQADKTLVVKGELGYQVCTETTCLMPATIPVEWTITLKPLNRQRASEKLQHNP